MTKKILICEKCGGLMKKISEATLLLGCLIMVVGLILLFIFPPIGTVIGVVLILIGLITGSRAKYYWVCTECGYKFERRKEWWELW